MLETRNCPKCGAELAAQSLGGICPRCVAQFALAGEDEPPPADTSLLPPTERPGDMVGRYKLLEKIGEGGFGVVYVAEQREPVTRRVALKIIKLGMDTRQVVGRFEAERQALALMEHPNIAKVLDAGALETGRPYFVMELVRGSKITDFCDQRGLSTRQRLGLFMRICQAVQHAHQKGIIHRDLKPSNILVTLHDEEAVPKVIDFGIAKATQGQLTGKTVYTQFGHFLGTPAYMSPEQAGQSEADIDTRSDIYSLGVLLYELLTGKTPFEEKDLAGAGLERMLRAIRDKEPPRPSTRLSTMEPGDLADTAARRQADAPRLIHLVRGDLDWIVMKCLEKDRARRYDTASGLAMDIQRHLNNEPVLARPPGNLYRFQKMVRRNKLAVTATGVVAAALAAGLGVSTFLYIREREALAEAEVAEKTVRTQAGQLLQAVQMMHSGATNLDEEETFYRQTLEMQKNLLGRKSPAVAATLSDLARVLKEEGKLSEAEAAQFQAVALLQKLAGPDDVVLADSLKNLGLMLQLDGKPAEAEPVFRQALALLRDRAASGAAREYSSLGVVLHHLAILLRQRQELPEARSLAEEAAALYQRHPDWPADEQQLALRVLGDVLTDLGATNSGSLNGFETLYRELLAVQRNSWPNDPAQWSKSICNLAGVLNSERKYADVDQLFDELLAAPLNDPRQRAGLLALRADEFRVRGLWSQAAADLKRAIEANPADIWNWYLRAPVLLQAGDRAAYLEHCRQMLERFGAASPEAGPGSSARLRLTPDPSPAADMAAKAALLAPAVGSNLDVAGRLADRAAGQPGSRWYDWWVFTEGLAQYRRGRYEDAAQWTQRVLTYPASEAFQSRAAMSCLVLAMSYHHLGQAADARAALDKGEQIVQTKLPALDSAGLEQSLPSTDNNVPAEGWWDVLTAHLLLREASELIAGSPK